MESQTELYFPGFHDKEFAAIMQDLGQSMTEIPSSYHVGLSGCLESAISQEDHKVCNIQYEMAVNEMEPITLTDQLTRYRRNGFSLNPYAKEFIPLKRTYTFTSQITSEGSVSNTKQFTESESPIHSALPTIEDINFAFRVLPRRLKESRVLKHLASIKGEIKPQESQQYPTASSLLVDDNCQQLARNPGLDNLLQSLTPAKDDTYGLSLTSEHGRFIDELQVPEFTTEQGNVSNYCDTPEVVVKDASNNPRTTVDYGLGMLVSSYVYQTNLHPSMIPDQYHSEIFQTRVIPPLRNPNIPEPIPVVVVARHDEKIQKYLNMDNSFTVWDINYSNGEWFMTRPDKIMAEKE